MRVPRKLTKPASGSSKSSNQSSILNSASKASVDSSINEGVNTSRNVSTDNRGVGVSTTTNTTATEVARSSSQPNAHFPPRGYQMKRASTHLLLEIVVTLQRNIVRTRLLRAGIKDPVF